jgi:hypothetical protein
MSRLEAAKALRGLRRKALAELERLDRERGQVEQLIEFIDEYAPSGRGSAPKSRRPRQRRRPASLLEVVRERPGVRTSMLAMVADRPAEEVAAELAGYERSGAVRREGLGWRALDYDG